MSQFVPPRPRVINVKRGFVIVASQFNAKYVQGLVNHCSDELRFALSPLPMSSCISFRVLSKSRSRREVALKKKADAIVALGVIIQGETDHAQHIGEVVAHALQRISLEHGVPGHPWRPKFEERSPGQEAVP
jgi:6,7-dimethyl-8-ribityllumazine synthase